jgi:sensor histidine kinase regulating citrate/malate metabolism
MNNFVFEKDMQEVFGNNVTVLLRAIMNCTDDAIIICDKNKNFLAWSEKAKKIVGLPPGNIDVNEWCKHYGLYKEDKKTLFDVEEIPLVSAANGIPVKDVIMYINNENQLNTWISCTAIPIKNNDEILGSIAFFRDVTELLETKQLLKQIRNNLENL